MEINGEQLAAIALGCRAVTAADGAWQFMRLPDALAAVYTDNAAAQVRIVCPSGVRLRFVSETTTLRLALRYGAAARAYYQGVALVDGIAYPFGATEGAERWEGEIYLGTRMSRTIDIWLPHLVHVDLCRLAIDDECEVIPVPLPRRWLAYGDSITQGMTVPLPTQMFIAQSALALQAEVRSLAFGGAMLDAILAQVDPGCAYDIVSIAYGTNDFNSDVPLETYAENARRLLHHLHMLAPARPILLITPIPWAGRATPNGLGATLEDYRAVLRPLTGEVPGCHIVEGTELITDDPALFVDGIHPNEAGMTMYAKGLTRALALALGQTTNPVMS